LKALPDNLGRIFGMKPYFDPTKRRPPNKNGRRPPEKLEMEDELKKKWKTASINFFKLE
jgi:hypothetical protein